MKLNEELLLTRRNYINSYTIELDRWNIKNDKTMPNETGKGLNDAVQWASLNGFNHALLPEGYYLASHNVVPYNRKDYSDNHALCVIDMPNDFTLELHPNAVIELQGNTSPSYDIIRFFRVTRSRITGGKLIGDRKTHMRTMLLTFERGGVNQDGSLNSNPNYIRTPIIDRYDHPGLLTNFRLDNPNRQGIDYYNFFQYNDLISTETLIGFRENVQFSPANPNGRGWFGKINECNKMIITIDIHNTPMTDEELETFKIEVSNSYYTHESGHCIGIYGGHYLEVDHIELCNAMGDGVLNGTSYDYKVDPEDYDLQEVQDHIGSHVLIHDNDIHRNRRQGLSITGHNDVYVWENKIHHIGKDDDGVTPDFIPPAFGIDIESLIGESNLPIKSIYYNTEGVEANFRIHIWNNYIHHNERGHFVNVDGTFVTIENNLFKGYNIGGITSWERYAHVKYENNTFRENCLFEVKGDNFINGAILENSSIKLASTYGAQISNVQIRNGYFYGNASYGYFGQPDVSISASRFSYSFEHGMGNGAKIVFEDWRGKVPNGIDKSKVYYTVNIDSSSFQVSESLYGDPIQLTNEGIYGFIIARTDYSTAYLQNITVSRDSPTMDSTSIGFNLLMNGGVLENITVKNDNCSIRVPNGYSGRPIIVNGLNTINSSGHITGCHIISSQFLSNIENEISFNSHLFPVEIKTTVSNSTFRGIKFLSGDVTVTDCYFIDSEIFKTIGRNTTLFLNNYLENTIISSYWLDTANSLIFSNNIFNHVDSSFTRETTVFDENKDITQLLPDLTPPQVFISPIDGYYPDNQTITFTSNKDETIIYYTLDGSEPTEDSVVFTASFIITSTTTVRYFGIDEKGNQSVKKKAVISIDRQPPADVTSLVAKEVSSDKVELSWSASISEDTIKYRVYQETLLIDETSDLSYTINNLSPLTSYEFTVTAIDRVGNESIGVSITVSTLDDQITPEEISNLTVSYKNHNKICLTWQNPDPNITFEVYLDDALHSEVASPYFIASDLSSGTSYSFKIISKNIVGNRSQGVMVMESTDPVFTGLYVTNGLLSYLETPVNHSVIENPNSYFSKNEEFTIAVTFISNRWTDIFKIWGTNIENRKVQLYRSGDYKFFFTLNGYDIDSKQFHHIPTIISEQYEDIETTYHVVAIRNNTTQRIELYVNNILVGDVRNITTNIHSVLPIDNTIPFIIGTEGRSSILHIAYYNRALNQEELTQNYNFLN
ncbi:chitobiase/beta-hexosaminidase C-terminal domain-containing protein [Bacillus carboniphilus]|uniref:Chitobiase/beta-hexosaminidase C-terminal domain-containing protein n=1 Tax=Bacillus carboniphilus TaxID=86663 RepID=A0ABY9JTT4_9BACI|nr:chitobiase/beta-hexosaminidase C-terminal domain-containing protein [Bacillus carboniphilus]WLR42799.1 chitobiase/beta-hexosaminidase C-terminal domain-containing protein [Bacillus carboniphilus]